MQFPNRVRITLQKTVLFSSPTGPSVGRIRYAPTTGYVRFFEIPMQFPNWVRMALQKTVPFSSPFGAVCGAYAIRPYNRGRAILRNTDAIFQLDTCGPSKNCPVFVPFGAAGWGVFNMSLRPGTCAPSKYRCNAPTGYVLPFKKLSCFHPLRGRLWGVFDTPLRPNTCDPSKYRCDPPTGYVRGFKKWICIRHRRWRMVGRIQYAPTIGYVRSFEIPMQYPDRLRAILGNTDVISRPEGRGRLGGGAVGVTACGGDGRE